MDAAASAVVSLEMLQQMLPSIIDRFQLSNFVWEPDEIQKITAARNVLNIIVDDPAQSVTNRGEVGRGDADMDEFDFGGGGGGAWMPTPQVAVETPAITQGNPRKKKLFVEEEEQRGEEGQEPGGASASVQAEPRVSAREKRKPVWLLGPYKDFRELSKITAADRKPGQAALAAPKIRHKWIVDEDMRRKAEEIYAFHTGDTPPDKPMSPKPSPMPTELELEQISIVNNPEVLEDDDRPLFDSRTGVFDFSRCEVLYPKEKIERAFPLNHHQFPFKVGDDFVTLKEEGWKLIKMAMDNSLKKLGFKGKVGTLKMTTFTIIEGVGVNDVFEDVYNISANIGGKPFTINGISDYYLSGSGWQYAVPEYTWNFHTDEEIQACVDNYQLYFESLMVGDDADFTQLMNSGKTFIRIKNVGGVPHLELNYGTLSVGQDIEGWLKQKFSLYKSREEIFSTERGKVDKTPAKRAGGGATATTGRKVSKKRLFRRKSKRKSRRNSRKRR